MIALKRPPAWFVGEFLGTFLLVFFGCGSVATAVLTGAQVGIFQVAIVWGIAIAMAIYLTRSLSGAHLNPAVTISFAAWTGFPWRRVPAYILVQFLAAICASGVLYLLYHDALKVYESAHGIARGLPGSEATAMIFGEYFPNPAGKPLTDTSRLLASLLTAFFAEMFGTGIMMLIILCVIDPHNATRPRELVAVPIGLTVTILISLLGPISMAAFNPARDLGPRLFSYFAGWGSIAFTANGEGWLTVYIIAPVLGALLAGGVYRWALAPNYSATGD